jgi:hypothetical protein
MNFEHRLGIFIRTLHNLVLYLPSSFYGLLDILSGTELNNGQREIGMCSLTLTLLFCSGLSILQYKRRNSLASSCLRYIYL